MYSQIQPAAPAGATTGTGTGDDLSQDRVMADVQHPDLEGDHKKKSALDKVKDKAKKLTSKMKGSTKKHKEQTDDHEAETTSGSEDETSQELGGSPVSSSPVSHGTASDDGVHGAAKGISELKISGEDSEAQKAGHYWNASHDEPRAAGGQPPSSVDETSKRQQYVPSSLGRDSSAGKAASPLGSEKESHKDVNAGFGNDGVTSGRRHADTGTAVATGTPIGHESEKSFEFEKEKSFQKGIKKPIVGGVDSSGRDLDSAEVVDTDKQVQPSTGGDTRPTFQEVAHVSADDSGSKESHPESAKESHPESAKEPGKGWTQWASDSVVSMKNVIVGLGSPKSGGEHPTSFPNTAAENTHPSQQQKTWTEQARDSAAQVKDTVSSKLPTSTQPSSTEEKTGSGGDKEVESRETVAPGITSRAIDTAAAAKDNIASKLGYGGESEVKPSSGTVSPSTQPTITEKVVGTVTSAKDVVASKLGYGQQDSSSTATSDVTAAQKPTITQKVGQSVIAAKENVASKLGYGQENSPVTATSDTSKSSQEQQPAITQTIGETDVRSKLGSGDDVASNQSATSADVDEKKGGEVGSAATGGVLGRVTGAVGSLIGNKPAETGKNTYDA